MCIRTFSMCALVGLSIQGLNAAHGQMPSGTITDFEESVEYIPDVSVFEAGDILGVSGEGSASVPMGFGSAIWCYLRAEHFRSDFSSEGYSEDFESIPQGQMGMLEDNHFFPTPSETPELEYIGVIDLYYLDPWTFDYVPLDYSFVVYELDD